MGAGERGRRGGGRRRRRRRARAARTRHRRVQHHRHHNRRRTGHAGRVFNVGPQGQIIPGGQQCSFCVLILVFMILFIIIGGILTAVGCGGGSRLDLCVAGPIILAIGLLGLLAGIAWRKKRQNSVPENATNEPYVTNTTSNNITFSAVDLEAGHGMFNTPPLPLRSQTVSYHVEQPSAPPFIGTTDIHSITNLPPPSYDSVTQQQLIFPPYITQPTPSSLSHQGNMGNDATAGPSESNPTAGSPPPPSYDDATCVNTERYNMPSQQGTNL
ncbi:unnamed protein product [Owenia fusiformis]|uniref:Uncharacterized protein n=1 Tax=Owenia fusiformis TaxID=6347 RepID=A0A8J1UQH5_OWEFU|nr:unnamed protein product [Owenia fusiformis]